MILVELALPAFLFLPTHQHNSPYFPTSLSSSSSSSSTSHHQLRAMALHSRQAAVFRNNKLDNIFPPLSTPPSIFNPLILHSAFTFFNNNNNNNNNILLSFHFADRAYGGYVHIGHSLRSPKLYFLLHLHISILQSLSPAEDATRILVRRVRSESDWAPPCA